MGTGIGFHIRPAAEQQPSLRSKVRLDESDETEDRERPDKPTVVTEIVEPPPKEKIIDLGTKKTLSITPLDERSLPDQPSSAQYEELSVNEFGDALRRGLQLRGAPNALHGDVDTEPRRSNLAGIGLVGSNNRRQLELPVKKLKKTTEDR